jgi:CRP/FNR family cyclic AMP-dependent transcriptional regulator
MLERTPHQTTAVAVDDTTCLVIDRDDIFTLLQQKPHAGMDMLTVLGRQIHNAQQLVRARASRYTAVNVVLAASAWDPYPFILLNPFLSMLAALQAPVIMMSQNRQDTKDRLRGELD